MALKDELKKELNNGEQIVDDKKDNTKVEKQQTVEIGKEDFQGLIATVQKLQQELDAVKKGESTLELPDVKVRKAKVHFYKDKVVDNVGRAWEIRGQHGEPEMRLEIFVEGKKHEVDYKDYRGDKEQSGFTSKDCVIKEIKLIDKGETTHGYTDLVEVDYDNFRSVAKYKVPLKVVTPKYSYVMDVDGQEAEVNPNALN